MLKLKLRIVLALLSALGALILVISFLFARFFIWDVDVLGLQLNPKVTGEAFCGVTDNTTVFRNDSIIDNTFTLNQTGENIFRINCSPCHAINETIVGPALANVGVRRSKEWLHQYIQNPEKKIKSGDPTALKLYNDYGSMLMPSFKNLSIQEIDSILQYIDQYSSLTFKSTVLINYQ